MVDKPISGLDPKEVRKIKKLRLDFCFSTLTSVVIDAQSAESAIVAAREQCNDDAWLKEHQDELLANLEPWEECDTAEEAE